MSIQYKIISPVKVDIMGESVTDALKKFVKMNRNLAINNLILQDEGKRMYARIRYFQNERNNKVGIDVYPTYPVTIPERETINLNVPLSFQGSSGLNMNTYPMMVDGEIKNMPLLSYPNRLSNGYNKNQIT